MWFQNDFWKNWTFSGFVLVIILLIAVGCGGGDEPAAEEPVEATRVVTETVTEVVEGEAVEVEVTRVVTEEIIVETEVETAEESAAEEEMEEEMEMEEEAAEELFEEAPSDPEAIGSEDDDGSPFEPADGQKVSATREAGDGWIDESLSAVSVDTADQPAVEQASLPAETAATPEPPTNIDEATDEIFRAGEEPLVELTEASQLTAGEINDNDTWVSYMVYLDSYDSAGVIPVDVGRRQIIRVLDSDGRPVLGATVTIEPLIDVAQAVVLQTTSKGEVLFFPEAYDETAGLAEFLVIVQHQGITAEQTVNIGDAELVWEIVWPSSMTIPEQTAVDILFLIDATGSMGDELQQLKDNILFMAQTISALPSQPDVRFGMTVYRDRGEAFTSRTFNFTADVAYFAEELALVEASGGGDYREDLNEGLYKALTAPAWRTGETVKLIFLVADAPPHIDYDDLGDYTEQMRNAAEQGIKIYPIGSSGLDGDGEYIFRQLAQFTGAKFLFLTYGAAGAGSLGTETDLAIGEAGLEYDVTSLDGLIIKIVEEELAYRPLE